MKIQSIEESIWDIILNQNFSASHLHDSNKCIDFLMRLSCRGESVLWCGLNQGEQFVRCCSLGFECFGIDFSARALALTQERLETAGLRATLSKIDLRHLHQLHVFTAFDYIVLPGICGLLGSKSAKSRFFRVLLRYAKVGSIILLSDILDDGTREFPLKKDGPSIIPYTHNESICINAGLFCINYVTYQCDGYHRFFAAYLFKEQDPDGNFSS